MVLTSLLALTKLVPLSDQKVSGRPRRATNLSIAIMHELVFRLWRTSRWIALVVRQVKIIHLFSVVRRTVTCRGPKQSRPVLVNAGFLYARRSVGRSAIRGWRHFALLRRQNKHSDSSFLRADLRRSTA